MNNARQMTTLSERPFGIELEFTGIEKEIAIQAIRNAGLECHGEYYNHSSRPYWKIVTDASCGLEAVSPILQGEEGIRQARLVCKALDATGAKVCKKTGFHIHWSVENMALSQVKNLFKMWLKYEDVFDTFQPESRRGNNNNFCQSNLSPFLSQLATPADQYQACQIGYQRIERARDMDELGNIFTRRYVKLNLQSFYRHRTIEVRHHSGTLNADKVENWIRFTNRFYETAVATKAVRIRPNNQDSGVTRLKWLFQKVATPDLRTFYTRRAKELAKLPRSA